jgi:hypothetical protein
MKVKLFNQSTELVAAWDIPPFVTPPDVVVWGYRAFGIKRYFETGADGEVDYKEIFLYIIPEAGKSLQVAPPVHLKEDENIEIHWELKNGSIVRQVVYHPNEENL